MRETSVVATSREWTMATSMNCVAEVSIKRRIEAGAVQWGYKLE